MKKENGTGYRHTLERDKDAVEKPTLSCNFQEQRKGARSKARRKSIFKEVAGLLLLYVSRLYR